MTSSFYFVTYPFLQHLKFLIFTCSIYKAALKSKGSINDYNQIAQVCVLLSLQIVSKVFNTELPSVCLIWLLTHYFPLFVFLAVTDCCKAKTFCGSRAIVQSTTGETPMKRNWVSFVPICSGVSLSFLALLSMQICYHVLGLVHEIWKPIPRTVCI